MRTTRLTWEKDGIVGKLFRPERSKRVSGGVVVLGGSDRFTPVPDYVGRAFAQAELTSIGLRYHGTRSLTGRLQRIPVEMVARAVGRLKSDGASPVSIYGFSTGAELALLAASKIPEIKNVVAVCPSDVVWEAPPGSGASEFTLDGRDVPFIRRKPALLKVLGQSVMSLQAVTLAQYERDGAGGMEESDIVAAQIPVEDIQGNILMQCPEHDTIWPSKAACIAILDRLKLHGFSYSVKIESYPRNSHLLVSCNPLTAMMFKGERRFRKECEAHRKTALEHAIQWVRDGSGNEL